MSASGDRVLRSRSVKREPLPANVAATSTNGQLESTHHEPVKRTFWQFVRASLHYVAIVVVFGVLHYNLTPIWDPRATSGCTLPGDSVINSVRNKASALCQLWGTSNWALCKGSYDLSRYPTAPYLPPYVTNLPATQSYASGGLRRVFTELIWTNIVSAFYGRVTLKETESVHFKEPSEYGVLFESRFGQVTPGEPLTFSVGKPMSNIENDRLWAHHFVGGINPMVRAHNRSAKDERETVQMLVSLARQIIERVSNVDEALEVMGATADKRDVIVKFLAEKTGGTKDNAFRGRLFLADYGEVADVRSFVEGRVVHSPAVLFYMVARSATTDMDIDDTPGNGSDGSVFELLPVAIQVTSGTSKEPQYKQHLLLSPTLFPTFDDECEFSPAESVKMWNFAKLCVMTADSHVHEFVSHLGETHLAVEPVAATFFAHFPAEHAFRHNFQQHFYGTLAINNLGRATLLSPGGMFDEVSSAGYKGALQLMNAHFERHWRYMHKASFPRRTRQRFFPQLENDTTLSEREKDEKTLALLDQLLPFEDDPDYKDTMEQILPWDFTYAQDGAHIWRIFQDYVKVLVDQSFPGLPSCSAETIDESAVDPYLREFVQDLRRMSLYEDAFPEGRVCREATTAFFTTTLWVASAQHSAVNFGQYDMYAFPPIRALMQQLPFPLANTDDGTCPSASAANEKLYVQALASLRQTINTMQAATSLSIMVATPLTQGLERTVWQQDGKGAIDHARFVALEKLSDLENRQKRRNTHLQDAGYFEYPWLMPNNMATSIDI
ncbi:MAG: hypothetical protein MHM6MM_003438 [Cercozoa sp. M6MM]